MNQKLSICIIDGSNLQDLPACTSHIAALADELIIVKTDPASVSDRDALSIGRDIPLSFVPADRDLKMGLIDAVRNARGEWILMMRSDEILTSNSLRGIRDLIERNEESAYYIACRRQPELSETLGMDRYEWVGSVGKYRFLDARKHGGITRPEVRLVRKQRLEDIRIQDDGSIFPVLRKYVPSIALSALRIDAYAEPVAQSEKPTKDQKWDQDYERYMNDPEEDPSRYEGLDFLAPDYIGYKLLDETNYPSLIAGLEMGWGHVDILKHWLVVQILHGDYDNAIHYATEITSTLGDHCEIWRLKGDASFLQLDLKNAEACYRKALSLQKDHLLVLCNLAKVCLFRGKHDEAKKMFLVLKDSAMQSPEIDFIINSLDEKSDHRVKLSLLMLCKDEEDYIARALESVKDVVDEMIVVDTGSRDRTRSIARELGAKVIKQSWSDHFSEARNAGLAHVTGDYVLWMDADEFIYREDQIPLLVLKSILSLKKPTGITFRIETFKEEQNTPNPLPPEKVTNRTAIFPHRPGIHFSGRIFESVDDSLDALGAVRFIAENGRFLHISENTGLRNERKKGAIEKCTKEPLGPESLFMSTLYWLNLGDFKKTEEWFERAVSEIQTNPGHDKIIGLLANALAQNDHFRIDAPYYHILLTKYRHSYPLISLCAHMQYQAGCYREAATLFEKIVCNEDGLSLSPADEHKKINDRVLFAVASLEIDNLEKYDEVMRQLSNEKNMYDTLGALRIYAEIRKRNIDESIGLLDGWIRHRNLDIKATLNGMVDFIQIIAHMAEIMISYNQMNAAHVLSRACEHLIETLHMKEQVNS